MADNLPTPVGDKPEDKARTRALTTIGDRKVSLQSVSTALATITTRPVVKLARALGFHIGRLEGVPDKKAVLSGMPKGSKVVLKRDGSVLIGMPDADKKSITDLMRTALSQGAVTTDMSVTREKLRLLNFNRKDVSGSDFRQAKLAGVDFVRAEARDTDFTETVLIGTCFEGADLRDANFTRARFGKESTGIDESPKFASQTDFAYADLTGARFSIDADLSNCRFQKARVEGVILVDGHGNPVEGARLTTEGQIVYDTIVATAEGQKATEEAEKSDLPDGVYTGLVNRDASLRNARGQLFSFRYKSATRGSNFGGSNLDYQGAVFENTKFTGANFTDGNLRGVDLTDSTIESIKVTGADLTDADWGRVTVKPGASISFKGATLTNMKLPISMDFEQISFKDATGADTIRLTDGKGKVIEGAKLVQEDGIWTADTSAVTNIDAYDIPRPLEGVPDMKVALKGLPKGTTLLLNRDGERLLAVPAKDDKAVSRGTAVREALKRKISLDNLSFTEGELEKTHFSERSAAGADFRKSRIRLSDFVVTDLSGADFSDTSLHECSFERANLRGTNFAGAKFTRERNDRYGTDFSGADLEGAVFSHDANFSGLRFDHANLKGVVIVDDDRNPIPGAVLTKEGEVVYLGADKTPDAEMLGSYDPNFVVEPNRPRWRNETSNGRNQSFAGRTFKDGSLAEKRDYTDVSFKVASFIGQTAKANSTYRNADFSGAVMQGMYFDRSDLQGADFSNITLRKPSRYKPLRLHGCKLDGARFSVSTDFNQIEFHDCSPKGIALVDDKGQVVDGAAMVEINGEWAVDLSNVEDRPDLKTARQLKGLPDPAQAAAHLPEGSKCIIRTDGTLLAALPNASKKKYRDVLNEALNRKLDLTNMSYRSLTLESANLNFQTLDGADFTEGKVHKVDFVGAKLQKARFVETAFVSPVFDQADLRGADFTGATFRKGDYAPYPRFVDADLRGAKFSFDVDLSRAQFYGAKLDGVQIIDADGNVIPGASLSHEGKVLFADAPEAQDAEVTERPQVARNDKKDYRHSYWDGRRMHDTGFSESTDISNSSFVGSTLSSFNFRKNKVHDCNFDGALLRSVSLSGCSLKGSRFTNIDWSECNRVFFENTDFEGAIFSKDADLSKMGSLKGANLNGVIFVDAEGNEVPDMVFREDGTVRDISPAGLAKEKAEAEEAKRLEEEEEARKAEEEENQKDALIEELRKERDTAKRKAADEERARKSAEKSMLENESDARLGRMIRDRTGRKPYRPR
ncbi:MAG: hypothetical protein Alpg2KO_10140 [Alphaproteobacteria bacterium]